MRKKTGRKNKIALRSLTQAKHNGGLNFLNIHHYDIASLLHIVADWIQSTACVTCNILLNASPYSTRYATDISLPEEIKSNQLLFSTKKKVIF